MAHDFWFTSGWHLLDKNTNGCMVPTEDFMAAYLARPELALIDESCDAEKALHHKLKEKPFSLISDKELNAIADEDAAGNYRAFLRFREYLGRFDTLEAAYLEAARGEMITFPPLFMDHMAHIILRNILDGESDSMKLRAAEILFREQRVTLDDGRIMVADRTTVDLQAEYQIASGQNTPDDEKNVMIDIMNSESAPAYWERNDLFNMSVDIAYTQPALDALCRVMESWITHFLGISCQISPMARIDDNNWNWHIGLDSETTNIFNDLYSGRDVSEDRLRQILCLFSLTADEGLEKEYLGTPIYLGLSMNKAGLVRGKPQNLLANLPLNEQAS